MTLIKSYLEKTLKGAKDSFKQRKSILSFEQYLEHVVANPHRHIRNSAQYFSDMVASFGSYQVKTPTENLTRYKLFDAAFRNNEGKIYGHEKVQQSIVENLNSFVRQGRIDKLILLHGPNGSAKTSIVQAIFRAAEHYSHSDDGALYQFVWVFPKKESVAGGFGFAKSPNESLESYAHLPNEAIEARIQCDQRDHPLLLLSTAMRNELYDSIRSDSKKFLTIPLVLLNGELSKRNHEIFDALLSAYNGDLAKVLRHVRVERFYLSGRYQRGLASIEPQMSVDASVRQITSDQSLMALPAPLRHLSLLEALGPLVDANRGMIEYSDLLKRPVDAWKYLLVACEQAQVSLQAMTLFFDLILMATSNELHLGGFKEYPDWPSFKGRIELIRVPYLLRSNDEVGIYERQIESFLGGIHVAPHGLNMAARWAVLTRLMPPSIERYEESMQEIIRDISPAEKLALYNDGEVPLRLSQKQARELRALIPQLSQEFKNEVNYEGRHGASPREIRALILKAAQDHRYDFVCPGAIFKQIELLVLERSSYEYLRREPVRGFHDAKELLESVKNHYVQILADEARMALGFYSKDSYLELFTRYINHVSAWTKKEKLIDPLFARRIDADESFMTNVEKSLMAQNESCEDFRRQLISQIAAFKLENPALSLDYNYIFPAHLRRLKVNLFSDQKEVVERVIVNYLNLSEDELDRGSSKECIQARTLKDGLITLQYNDKSARWAMAYLYKNDDYSEKIQKIEEPGLNLT